MRYEQLGRTGIRISKIGLGTWQFGASYWGWGRELGEEDAISIIREAVDLGINFIDTAEIYGWGRSERIVGRALRSIDREEVVIATKVFPYRVTVSGVLKALRNSLRRLNTGYVDLYQIHWPSPIFPLKGAMRALERELEEGRIRAIGVSNFSLKQMEEARSYLQRHDLASNQIEYNLLKRDPERDLIPHCRREGITIIAYSPLAQGLLTGKYGPGRMPKGIQRRLNIWHLYGRIDWSVVERLKELAARKGGGTTPAQLALAWVIREEGVVAIPGAKSLEQLRSNAKAAEIELGEEELSFLEGRGRG